ncbi:EAL domain-containing protein [Pseudochrobactrum sp. sp1633]|uniref:putative bifunctional diguanylate cyclase/phosphodiesterase n=1 Tax=Pseudochrobactrum sp. sp1633 TaxID=3036706 RepID=UPI0025A64E07|nr:EAL domain-containing protein [Pseudochrobactrum sp. sp1633]MDM8346797.1 EAL domain-containing protein [Pseudochrobactrum sp. sp1633]HWD14048.1 EAL domain-containing protein [Pseudochrobactrum sp.]
MRRILGVIICCFVLATGYIAYVIAERQTALQKFARYNDSWAVSQMLSEYMRLEQRLAAYALGVESVDLDEVHLRLDIIISRLEFMQQGTLYEFVEKNASRRQLIANLKSLLDKLDQQFDVLDVDHVKALLPDMIALDGPLTALAASSVEYDVGVIDTAQREVQKLHYIYTALAGGLILCGIALIILLLRQNKLLNNAHGRMKRLTDDLRETSGELQSQNYRLEHSAHHDALTGLPNRILFRQDLEARMKTAREGGGAAVVLLFDLDGFKDVNDTLGHDVGDVLLQAVAGRLTEFSHRDDLICRLGGDEFAVVSAGLAPEPAYEFAQHLMNVVSSPYHIKDHEIKIGTCIGVAISSSEPDMEELFKRADLALYEAKALGTGHVCIFQPHMQTRLLEKKAFEADLHDALKNGEMEVYYQPQVDTFTREICGYEALLRWTHPKRGAVPPSEFIPVAEKTGMIHELGDWVLKVACCEAVLWNRPLKVAVNLSPVQFITKDLIQRVKAILKESGLDPQRLELEITESVLLDKNEQTLRILRQLKAIGIQIAMDDFGTGYSSLGSLSSFPFDKIKIDRSFIRDVTTRADALAIVELVTGIGQSLGMITIAEGIETEEELECLKRVGCDQLQGYLFGRPVPASELAHLRK